MKTSFSVGISTSIIRVNSVEAGALRIGVLADSLMQHGVDVEFIVDRGTLQRNYITAFRKEIKGSKGIDVDVIYVYTQNPTMSLLGDIIKHSTDKKVINHIAAPSLDSLRSLRGLPVSWRTAYQILVNNKLWFRFSKRLADAYIVNSGFQRDQLLDMNVPDDQVFVLPPLIDERRCVAKESDTAKHALNLDTRYSYVSYVGHFTAAKGVEDLITAYKAISEEHPHSRLVLAWSGYGSRERIQKRIEMAGIEIKRIVWMGEVDVGTLLSASTVLVLPYRHYVGTTYPPNLVLEAICTGTPILTTDVGCVSEYITHGQDGYIIPPRSPHDLEEGLNALLTNQELRSYISTHQLEKSSRYYLNNSIHKYINLFERIIQS